MIDSIEDYHRMLEEALSKLSEHFDTIQIFATTHNGDDNGTSHHNIGTGNWYARYGQVKCWVKTVEALDVEEAVNGEEEE